MPNYNEALYNKLPKNLESKIEELIEKGSSQQQNICEEGNEKPAEIKENKPMPYRMEPVYYTIKELEALYKRQKITFRELELYKHCPHKIPVKSWQALPEQLDTSTKIQEPEDNNSTKTI